MSFNFLKLQLLKKTALEESDSSQNDIMLKLIEDDLSVINTVKLNYNSIAIKNRQLSKTK